MAAQLGKESLGHAGGIVDIVEVVTIDRQEKQQLSCMNSV